MPHGLAHASTFTSQRLTPFNDHCEVVTFGVEWYEHLQFLPNNFMNLMVEHNMLAIDNRQLNNEKFDKI
jgi:hypothetical protein